MTRREKLLAACEYVGINPPETKWQKGAFDENAKLKPFLTALIDRVEQLEGALSSILNEGNMATQGQWDATHNMKEVAFHLLNGPSPLDPWLRGDK